MKKGIFHLSLEELDDYIDDQEEQEDSNDDSEGTVIEKQSDTDKNQEVQVEKEYVLYFRTLNFKQFSKASRAEDHLQWEIKVPKTDGNAAPGRMRCRKTILANGKASHSLTVKNKAEQGNFESTSPVNETFFKQFMLMSDAGMHKHRYVFPVEGTDLEWEIDIYPDGKNGYYTWGRAELEVSGPLSSIPPLPIEAEEIITVEDQKTNEGMEKVQWLYSTFFLKPNPYVALNNSTVTGSDEEEPKDSTDELEENTVDEPEDTQERPESESSDSNENEESTDDDNDSDDQDESTEESDQEESKDQTTDEETSEAPSDEQ